MDLFFIIYFALVIYSLRIFLFFIGVQREKNRNNLENDSYLPTVTIIIPAKDEEENIENCIRSIAENNYPGNLFEIIAIDDRSKDSTFSIMKNLQKIIPNLKIKKIEFERKHKNLKGKAGAIQYAIKDAQGEIILMTDADCVVGKNWISTMVKPYQDDQVGLVTSITNVRGKRIFDKIQSIEWIYLTTMGAGGVGLNKPLSCFGNNLSVRKSDFLAIGGYEKINFSVTEDLALLHSIHKFGKKIRYLINPNTLIDTTPNKTFSDYLKQHHRWVVGGLGIGFPAFLFILTSLAMWIGIAVSIATLNLWELLAILLVKFLGDFFLIFGTLRTLRLKGLAVWVIPSVLFFVIMELVAPFFLLDRSIEWKDQEFKN